MLDIEYFKTKLLDERSILMHELESLGEINPEVITDWQAKPENLNIDTADEMEIADSIESFEERNAIQNKLENRLIDVEKALERIAIGTYGVCEISGQAIETERLEANPAARTNIANKDKTIV